MNKKVLSGLTVSLIICTLFSTTVFAYRTLSSRPSAKQLYWGIHSTTPSDAINAAVSAGGNWGSADGLQASYNFNEYTGNIDPSDSDNSVGASIDEIPGAPSGWVAAAFRPSSNYTTFDIVIHSTVTFGNGSGTTYCDYQGVFRHEFGHVFGLADLPLLSIECLGKTASDMPTMFYSGSLNGTLIYYYLRSTETDDRNGKAYVSSLIQ